MVYIRLAAAAALAASLAGCSVVGSGDRGPKFQESGGPDPAWPAQSLRLACCEDRGSYPSPSTGYQVLHHMPDHHEVGRRHLVLPECADGDFPGVSLAHAGGFDRGIFREG